jgi:hypothetical protein
VNNKYRSEEDGQHHEHHFQGKFLKAYNNKKLKSTVWIILRYECPKNNRKNQKIKIKKTGERLKCYSFI